MQIPFTQNEIRHPEAAHAPEVMCEYASQTAPILSNKAVELLKSSRETVLLVEDEPSILAISRKVLERLGYTVLSASKPAEAIELVETNIKTIHLLVTDIVLPGMSGRDLATRLLSLRPKLKCLFMSGYTADIVVHHGVLDKGVHFIQKPFSIENLAMKVRETLEAA